MPNFMKITECPRDAMQGLHDFIPTDTKADYLNTLLQVGFDTLDFGSFVSPKAIPQLRDTAEVLGKLNLDETNTKLLAIIANLRGAQDACKFDEIQYLGFPLSASEQFQQRNTNKSISDALVTIQQIQELCIAHNKQLVVYISMGFGNPYNEPYSPEIVGELVQKLDTIQIPIIALSDTIGVSTPENISPLFSTLIPAFPSIEFGAHMHSNPLSWHEKISSAYDAGCRRFDGALKGFGGCPLAEDKLVGNIATENLIGYCLENNIELELDQEQQELAMAKAMVVFP